MYLQEGLHLSKEPNYTMVIVNIVIIIAMVFMKCDSFNVGYFDQILRNLYDP